MFTTLHILLLFGFLGVTSLLLVMTVANRFRIRDVLLHWRTGRFFGLPVWPAFFMVAVLALLIYTRMADLDMHSSFFMGYLIGGAFWFTSVLLSSAVIVTEYGVIQNRGRTGRSITWRQVTDYFEIRQSGKQVYVFIYMDDLGVRRRFEVDVPAAERQRFKQILHARVDARMEHAMQQAYGKKALEG